MDHGPVEITGSPCSQKRVMHIDTEESSSKRLKRIEEALECPVCFDTPRAGPIYCCINGHHACQFCSQKITSCPICNGKVEQFRCLLAEKATQIILDGKTLDCRYSECDSSGDLEEITKHEGVCRFRLADCPGAVNAGVCKWIGPFHKFLQHFRETGCSNILTDKDCQTLDGKGAYSSPDGEHVYRATFLCALKDLVEGGSVFERTIQSIRWRPLILLTRKIRGLWCYLTFHRNNQGQWLAILRSMLPQHLCDRIKCRVAIKGRNDTSSKFGFEGTVNSHFSKMEQIMKRGHYLHVTDAMVKAMGNKGANALFKYKVELEFSHKLVTEVEASVIKGGETEDDQESVVGLFGPETNET